MILSNTQIPFHMYVSPETEWSPQVQPIPKARVKRGIYQEKVKLKYRIQCQGCMLETVQWISPVRGIHDYLFCKSTNPGSQNVPLCPGSGGDRVPFPKKLGWDTAGTGLLAQTSHRGIAYHVMSCSVYSWRSCQEWGQELPKPWDSFLNT